MHSVGKRRKVDLEVSQAVSLRVLLAHLQPGFVPTARLGTHKTKGESNMKNRSGKLVTSTFQRCLLTAFVVVGLPGWHVAHPDPSHLLSRGAFAELRPLGPSVTVSA